MADTQTTTATPSGESRWAMTPEALESLLDLLGPDRDTAARKYEEIRSRLLRIFQWRGCPYPEELVDETMTRVAHKAAGGLELRSDEPFRYFCGVAQMIFKEVLRENRKKQEAFAEIRYAGPPPEEEEDPRMDCLRECLEELTPENHELMMEYYSGDGRRRIRRRKALAERLGIAMNALRIRAYRLRARLETCMLECAGRNESLPSDTPS